MFETSGDILNIVIAVCVLAFTIFIVLVINNLLVGLKKVKNMVKEVDKSVRSLLGMIDNVKNKVQKSTSYVYMASEVAKNIFDLVKKNKSDDEDYEDDDYVEVKKTKRKRKKKE